MKNKILLIILVILFVVLITCGIYLLSLKVDNKNENNIINDNSIQDGLFISIEPDIIKPEPEKKEPSVGEKIGANLKVLFGYLEGLDLKTVDTTNWTSYKNEAFGFSFKYPSVWGDVILESKLEYIESTKDNDVTYDLCVSSDIKSRKDEIVPLFYNFKFSEKDNNLIQGEIRIFNEDRYMELFVAPECSGSKLINLIQEKNDLEGSISCKYSRWWYPSFAKECIVYGDNIKLHFKMWYYWEFNLNVYQDFVNSDRDDIMIETVKGDKGKELIDRLNNYQTFINSISFDSE